jgi:hypothetical protein
MEKIVHHQKDVRASARQKFPKVSAGVASEPKSLSADQLERMSDELLGDLHGILGIADLMDDGLVGPATEQQLQLVEALVFLAMKMETKIEALVAIARTAIKDP